LFGQTYDDRAYKNVTDACALKADFQMLPAGDDTEIGEKVSIYHYLKTIIYIGTCMKLMIL